MKVKLLGLWLLVVAFIAIAVLPNSTATAVMCPTATPRPTKTPVPSPTPPTAVELAYFNATGQGHSVYLEWETATETDNVGFNLYRASRINRPRTKINGALIPAMFPGSPVGATYSWVDNFNPRTPSGYYYYWLEAVDIYGGSTLYGPERAEGLR